MVGTRSRLAFRPASVRQLPIVGCPKLRLFSAAPYPHIDNMHVGEGLKLSSCDIYRCSQGRLIILFGRALAASVGNFDDDNHGVFSQSQDSNSRPGGGVTATLVLVSRSRPGRGVSRSVAKATMLTDSHLRGANNDGSTGQTPDQSVLHRQRARHARYRCDLVERLMFGSRGAGLLR
jgi:hypothetical protein